MLRRVFLGASASLPLLTVAMVLLAAGSAFFTPTLSSLISKQAGAQDQGEDGRGHQQFAFHVSFLPKASDCGRQCGGARGFCKRAWTIGAPNPPPSLPSGGPRSGATRGG